MAATPTPFSRTLALLRPDRGDVAVLLVATAFSGLLTLSLPLAMQALVNTVAAGVLSQPVVTLALLVLAGTAIAGGVTLYQMTVVEQLQQRVFVRTALRMADTFLRARPDGLRQDSAGSLVKRFFDVLTIQKSLSKLLFDGSAAAFQMLVGLTLLAVYDVTLLMVSLTLVVLLVLVVGVGGVGGLKTSLYESKTKYAVADALDELARGGVSMRVHVEPAFLLARVDKWAEKYVKARAEHYRITWRQAAGHVAVQSIAAASMLGVGGFAVINGRLTLGQLVAAQLVLTLVLAATDKLVRQSDEFFDLLTGLDKVTGAIELDLERVGGEKLPRTDRGVEIKVSDVTFGYRADRPVLQGVSLSIAAGERVALVGISGSGKTTLENLVAGVETASHGEIEVDGVSLNLLDLREWRRQIAVAGEKDDLFEGTVTENVAAGRPEIGARDVAEVLRLVGFGEEADLPDGAGGPVRAGGSNLSKGQGRRILLARALAGRPRLVWLDEAFEGLEAPAAVRILRRLADPANPWTLVVATHRPELVAQLPRAVVIEDGVVTEDGPVENLIGDAASCLNRISTGTGLDRRVSA